MWPHRSILAFGAVAVTFAAPALAFAQPARPVSRTPEILPLEEETRLALSAAPSHLRDGAGVVALTARGFVIVRPSENHFTCVVNRDHPLNLKPTCYDEEGTATILPAVRFVGEQMLKGVTPEEIEAQVKQRFDSGEFMAPRRPGIAYMLSTGIRIYDAERGEFGTFPPHIMFYAPGLTNEDISTAPAGQARERNPWLPFVAYEGPHGFIIVVVGAEK